MSLRHTLLKIILPILIIAAGLGGSALLIKGRKPPAREAKENPGALVEVMTVGREDIRVLVGGTGTLRPRHEAKIIPQVSGRIVTVAPDLVAGGFFARGDGLFEIEDLDYRLAVERAKGTLATARYEFVTVETQARIARIEWDRLSEGTPETPNPLVLYEPQLENARAAVAAASAALEQAELNLTRTRVTAPFDCLIRSKNVDVGQFVSPGASVVEVVGTGTGEIIVPLPLEELAWLTVPGPTSSGAGSEAVISLEKGDATWTGRIVRSLGEVDPVGRMARVAVAVDDPYGLAGRNGNGGPSLQFGMFVKVSISGKILRDVSPLPRQALRDGDTVWIVDTDNLLGIRPVRVLRKEADRVLVGDGLAHGDQVVLTTLTGAANGMKLRPRPLEETSR